MCCSVQFPRMETFLSPTEEPNFDCFPILKSTINNKACNTRKREKTENLKTMKEVSVKSKSQTGHEPGSSSPSSEEEAGKKKKKKKWKKVTLADTGFNLSLFPRPTTAPVRTEEEERIFRKVEAELENYDNILCKCEGFLDDKDKPFDGKVNGCEKFTRRDRDRRVQKASRQVKDKYCTSVKNNMGRKKLYIHHRLFKLINLELRKMAFLPSSKFNRHIEIKNNNTTETRSRLKPSAPYRPDGKPAPVQNLRHTLHQSNAPSTFESTVVNLLIGLQHRELTPEDYEILLQLDDSVAPKTIDKSLLTSFKTDTVTAENAGETCPVCMDQYEIGQNRKFLPCEHVFHASCIDMWLENSSRNCPVDGLPVDRSS